MIEYRKARPEERDAYVAFADTVFLGDSFEQILPKVYAADADGAHMQTLAVDPEKGIRGMIGVMPGILHAGKDTLKTGFIGTVSVHPEARGEGIMKKLMSITLDDMRRDGVDMALLGGQRQRYEYFGYVQGGVEYEFRVGGGNVRHALKDVDSRNVKFEAVLAGSDLEKQLKALHETRPLYFERKDFRTCCISYLNRLYAALLDGRAIGWIVCSGRNTREDISEIMADSCEHFDAVLKAWIEQNDLGYAVFTLPDSERRLVRHVSRYAGGTNYRHSASIRILNHANVIEKLLRVKAGYTHVADGKVSFDIDGERFSVEVTGGKVAIGECGENPVCLSQFEADMALLFPHDYEGKPPMPEGWFPLPAYAASPDSF